MRGVAIQYGDVAPEAKENFIATTSEALFDTLDDFKLYNTNFPNYGNACENYLVLLDGKSELLSENIGAQKIGLVSNSLSEDDGTFNTPIVLTLESDGQYSSQGLTFTFDTYNNIYATDLNIKWYRVTNGSETLLDDKDFTPTSPFYFCKNQIENYNKLIITFNSVNMPGNRLRLRIIDYGYGTFFYGDELRNVKLIQEICPISTEISINTADFTLDSKGDIEYSFQTKQPLSIFFNDVLLATTFVKGSKRKGKYLWDVQTEDYVGLLDSIPFSGGIYVNKNAVDLINEICTVAKVPAEISNAFSNSTVSGYIAFTTCREALMQVAFAIQAIVDTSNSDKIKFFELDDTVTQTIPLSRILQGQNFDGGTRITAVEVSAHTFTEISETVDLYKAAESGSGDNIFVKFSEPMHDLSITNGTIVSRETNYAIINASANGILRGQKYEHTVVPNRKNNPVVLASDIENIVSIENATLVSAENVTTVLNNCYDWLLKVDKVNLKIVEGKHISEQGNVKYGQKKYGMFKYGQENDPIITYDEKINVGDNVRAETEYIGTVEGVVIQQSFNLNGNIVIKEAVLR